MPNATIEPIKKTRPPVSAIVEASERTGASASSWSIFTIKQSWRSDSQR